MLIGLVVSDRFTSTLYAELQILDVYQVISALRHSIRGLPLITYAPRGRGQVSHTFLLRITCKKGGGGGGGEGPDSM